MKKTLIAIALATLSGALHAQTPPPVIREFGKIDKADLELKSCDFEPDANAEVLFDKANVYYDQAFNICMDRQKRIKIFNDNGKNEANITLEYTSIDNVEYITGLQAETINLVDGKPEIIKIDKKQIFTKQIDKQRSAIVFSMPNVKPGSIIEFKYRWTTQVFYNMPDWSFQGKIPVKYSELKTEIPELFSFKMQPRSLLLKATTSNAMGNGSVGSGTQQESFNTNIQTTIISDIKSLQNEPMMISEVDNLQGVYFHLTAIRPINGFVKTYSDSWSKVGGNLADDEDFGRQLKRKLAGEEAMTSKAKAMKTDEEKISYLYNYVKTNIKWNGDDSWYTNDGTTKAWDKKTGNSAEVNLILYHLLKASGVNVFPMVASTRSHGKVNPAFAFLSQFNRAVVYARIDTSKSYVLDATDKYNLYNEIPSTLLNSHVLYIDKEHETYNTLFLEKRTPSINFITIDAEITPEGKMTGQAEIASQSYDKVNATERYKDDGEKKYIEYLSDGDNNLKISDLKMENIDVDSLALNQKMKLAMDLVGSDGTYIYLNPNLLTAMHKNPFTAETRNTDIDFGYMHYLLLNSNYKMPAGYKLDSQPKTLTLNMPDNSMSFKRTVITADGQVIVRYSFTQKKALFFKENYPEFQAFYKKMNELMNEQIVLKKS